MYSVDEDLDPAFTIKVIGHQWYWSYEWNNNFFIKNDKNSDISYKNQSIDSVMIQDNDLQKGDKRLLTVDNVLSLPQKVTLRFLVLLKMFYILEQYQNWV